MAGVSQSWRTIEGVLEEHANSVYRALRKPATDAALARLAKLVPVKLPRDYVQSLKIQFRLDEYGGIWMDCVPNTENNSNSI
jgi:cell wall assembly regulator SMI1